MNWFQILALVFFALNGSASEASAQPTVSQEVYQRYLEEITGGHPQILDIDDRQTAENKQKFRSYFWRSLQEMGFLASEISEETFALSSKNLYSMVRSYPAFSDYPEVHGTNLVAEIKGTERPDEVVIISAHYDTVPGTVGANDNGTGTAAVMSIARALKSGNFSPKRTIRFVLYDFEETGLFGSEAHFKNALLNDEEIVLAINLDMIGYAPEGSSYRLAYGAGPFQNTVGSYLEQVLSSSDSELFLDSSQHHGFFPRPEKASYPAGVYEFYKENHTKLMFSDGISAFMMGFPSVTLIENSTGWTDYYTGQMPIQHFYPVYHQPQDRTDQINFAYATEVTQFALDVTQAASMEAGNPWDRQNAKAYRQQLKAFFRNDSCSRKLTK